MEIFLKPDICKHYSDCSAWLRDKLLALIDINGYNSVDDFLMLGLSDKFRQKYNKSRREGFTITLNEWDYRNEHLRDIYEINTSMPDRQGRAMHPSYSEPQIISPGKQCPDHYIVLFLCKDPSGKIVGYIEYYIIGKFSYTSRVLGHKDYFRYGIMHALFVEVFKFCKDSGIDVLVYGEWLSGTPGLQFFKRETGFKPITLNERP